MALMWYTQATGTLKGKEAVKDNISLAGINKNITNFSPNAIVTQVNKILDIGGKSLLASEQLTFDCRMGVYNDE